MKKKKVIPTTYKHTHGLYTYIGGDAHAESSEVIANGIIERRRPAFPNGKKKTSFSPNSPPQIFSDEKEKHEERNE